MSRYFRNYLGAYPQNPRAGIWKPQDVFFKQKEGIWGSVRFDPLSLSPVLWLDASDDTTITTVSGAVSQWNDKSGNNRNVTQTTASARPLLTVSGLNGKNVVTFDGINDFFNGTSGITTTSSFSFFAIGTVGFSRGLDGAGTGWSIQSNTNEVGVVTSFPSVQGNSLFYTEPSIFRYGGFSQGGNLVGSTNGGPLITVLANRTNLRASTIDLALGRFASTTIFSSGYLGNLIIFDRALDFMERALIKGWLAWKWELVANLPNNHPYKFIKVIEV